MPKDYETIPAVETINGETVLNLCSSEANSDWLGAARDPNKYTGKEKMVRAKLTPEQQDAERTESIRIFKDRTTGSKEL